MVLVVAKWRIILMVFMQIICLETPTAIETGIGLE